MNLNSGSLSSRDASTSTLSFSHSTKVIITNKERLKNFLSLYKKFFNYQENLPMIINLSVKHLPIEQ